LMQREGLTEGDAFARLRGASQRSGQPMKLIADAIVAALS
jgi:AmiR/NasT family two-component response regulator